MRTPAGMREFARVGSLEAAVWLTTALYSGNTVSRVLFSFGSSPGPDGLYGVYAADPMPALSFTETELETCSSEDVVAAMRRRRAPDRGRVLPHPDGPAPPTSAAAPGGSCTSITRSPAETTTDRPRGRPHPSRTPASDDQRQRDAARGHA